MVNDIDRLDVDSWVTVNVTKATVEQLQMAHSEIETKLRLRFAQRRETCQHPTDARGYVEQPRPSNSITGCTYCLKPLPSLLETTTEAEDIERLRKMMMPPRPWWRFWPRR